jgi:hypothetical protein
MRQARAAALGGAPEPKKGSQMRKLIAGMKISVDGKMEAAEGMADWVQAWSEDYGLIPQIDACLLGSGMYGGSVCDHRTSPRPRILEGRPASGRAVAADLHDQAVS